MTAIMANQKRSNRGKVITYDRVPEDVFDKIQLAILEIKTRTKRGRVSMSEAITKLIRKA